MNEYTIGFTFCGGIVGIAATCVFYMMGGRNNKALRRFLAPGVFTLTMVVMALILGVFKWALLAMYIFKMLEYIQGYSNRDNTGWIKRTGVAATSILAGVFMCYIMGGGWNLLWLHVPMSLSTVLFSFKNPIAAAAEEPLICAMNCLILQAYLFTAI